MLCPPVLSLLVSDQRVATFGVFASSLFFLRIGRGFARMCEIPKAAIARSTGTEMVRGNVALVDVITDAGVMGETPNSTGGILRSVATRWCLLPTQCIPTSTVPGSCPILGTHPPRQGKLRRTTDGIWMRA